MTACRWQPPAGGTPGHGLVARRVGGSLEGGRYHLSPARLPGRSVPGLEAGLQIEKIAARSPWQGSDG